ncbi:hypothetical protein DFH07DRAFT_959678 [Mycena maculata]|uniref:Secreted protein n=1 Tax=Mycena maculata TaxID=230809 RepID=A0AAD7J290_9AGAR|nr:hypothetical protein DFH07DRAFT_959678 [Mycena maculata]
MPQAPLAFFAALWGVSFGADHHSARDIHSRRRESSSNTNPTSRRSSPPTRGRPALKNDHHIPLGPTAASERGPRALEAPGSAPTREKVFGPLASLGFRLAFRLFAVLSLSHKSAAGRPPGQSPRDDGVGGHPNAARARPLLHVAALALSDLPWPLLRNLKNVQDLTLACAYVARRRSGPPAAAASHAARLSPKHSPSRGTRWGVLLCVRRAAFCGAHLDALILPPVPEHLNPAAARGAALLRFRGGRTRYTCLLEITRHIACLLEIVVPRPASDAIALSFIQESFVYAK